MNEAILSRTTRRLLKERIERAARTRQARRAIHHQKTKGAGSAAQASKPACRTTGQTAY